MVTIKKPDGSFVRVPLSQLKTSAAKPRAVSSGGTGVGEPATPAKITPKNELPPIRPLPKIELPGEKLLTQSNFTKEDATSLLEEEAPKANGSMPRTSEPRLDQTANIMKKLSFEVPDDLVNRLRSTIQLRLKDIRGDEATKEGLMRPVEQGGLGLKEAQADELVNACKNFTGGFGMEPKFIVSTEKQPPQPNTGRPWAEKPVAPVRPSAPQAKPIQPPSPVAPIRENLSKASPPPSFAKEIKSPEPRLAGPEPRPIVQDVISSRSEVGPVEELRIFNLTEFRRLASSPTEAASRLGQKFINLRDESYLLYMDAQRAWRESPLFRDYMSAVKSALLGRQNLASVLGLPAGRQGEKNKIQLSEIKAIVLMEKSL